MEDSIVVGRARTRVFYWWDVEWSEGRMVAIQVEVQPLSFATVPTSDPKRLCAARFPLENGSEEERAVRILQAEQFIAGVVSGRINPVKRMGA